MVTCILLKYFDFEKNYVYELKTLISFTVLPVWLRLLSYFRGSKNMGFIIRIII